MSTVYLYKYREYVQLVMTNHNVPNINLPMIIYDTKVYKGVTNNIEFIIRNNDRKPVNLVGFGLIAQIRAVNNPSNSKLPTEVLLEKPVTVIDETLGKCKLIFDPDDIENWSTGYYRYTVRMVYQDGRSELLFTDVNKSTWGSFELIEGISSSVVPAVEFAANRFTTSPIGEVDFYYTTGAVAGDAQAERASGTHTVAVYTNNWNGRFWVEGSLSNEAPYPSEWFPIQFENGLTYVEIKKDTPSPTLISFTMNLFWIRFSYKPDANNTGTFNKILYKN